MDKHRASSTPGRIFPFTGHALAAASKVDCRGTSSSAVRNDMKKLFVLIATLTAGFMSAVVVTAVPAGAVVKHTTRAYVGSARYGTAVHISGLVNINNSFGLVRSPGRAVHVQRYNGGSWHTILWRVSNSAGRITVGFTQPQSYRYRISVSGTSAALSANSAATLVRAAASSASGTVIHNAYTTGYGWPDNFPAGYDCQRLGESRRHRDVRQPDYHCRGLSWRRS